MRGGNDDLEVLPSRVLAFALDLGYHSDRRRFHASYLDDEEGLSRPGANFIMVMTLFDTDAATGVSVVCAVFV